MKQTYIPTNLRRYTFQCPKIKQWVEDRAWGNVLNLFAGKIKLKLKELRIDIDKNMIADYYCDAYEFVKTTNFKFDTVIADPPYCYDEKTEVLTENGWRFFRDLNYEEKIATLNTSTHELEYHRPTEYISHNYNGKMIKIKSGSVNLLVTPNHDLYVRKLWKTNKFTIVRAEDINFGCEFKSDCRWIGQDKKYFVLPEVNFKRHNRYGKIKAGGKKIKMEDWLQFFGVWLAEGCVDRDGTKYRVRISQTKKNNRKIIRKWIEKIGYHYLTSKNEFTIYNKQLCMYLRQFGKTKEKFIPKEIKKLSPKFLKPLFEGLMLGDGYRSRKEKWDKRYKKLYIDSHTRYSSCSKQLIDDVSEIVLKLGMVTTLYKNDGVYTLNITKHRLTPMIRKSKFNNYIKEIPYEGKVYCVNIPNHIIYVRRNGNSVWCSNSIRKSMEMYNGHCCSKFKRIADEIPGILNKDGIVISFGYNNTWLGKIRGFELKELCVFGHGGAQHCTIAIIEGRDENN